MDQSRKPHSRAVLDSFWASFDLLLSSKEPVTEIGKTVLIPQFPQFAVSELCDQARSHFMRQPIVLRIDPPICILGDIHGNLHDLVRILRTVGLTNSFLFLGDYVDRGQFSMECICMLFTLTLSFPDRFFLLRGNHEDADIACSYGFKTELLTRYREKVFDEFCRAFDAMPLAAVVGKQIFCVHGGLSPRISCLADIEELERPLTELGDAKSLLWADPNSQCNFRFGDSLRGNTVEYGPVAVDEFLRATGCRLIVRAHQCVDGVRWERGMPVVTVFSSSGYLSSGRNQAGCLLIDESGAATPLFFQQQEVVDRASAEFFTMECQSAEPTGLPRVTSLPLAASGASPVGILRSASRLFGVAHIGAVPPASGGGIRAQFSSRGTLLLSADRQLLAKKPREMSFAEDD
jgi:diadenosine tetraphosphatase ApaH/serine/threonine PP2A family protein phosphatase